MRRYDLSLDPAATSSLRHVGRERQPVLQIDGLLRTPLDLVDYAAAETAFAPAYGPAGGYPGIRAPAPLDYVETVVRAVDPLLRQAFGMGAVRLAGAECNFSLVTLAPDALVAEQRAPHIDTNYPLQFAFLHYLCGPEQGGTAFYRHRATGFEALPPERNAAYEAARAAEAEEGTGYIAGDTAYFEQTDAVAARFNRLVVYRSHLLHSGRIPPRAALLSDPRRGRLTANIFVTYREP